MSMAKQSFKMHKTFQEEHSKTHCNADNSKVVRVYGILYH